MSEPLMDFATYVGKYEIKRFDELPKKGREYERRELPNMPYLVQVGTAELRKPKLDHLRGAVGHLLQTQTPKWLATQKRWRNATFTRNDDGEREVRRDVPFEIDPDELTALKKNVLLIARHIGMLSAGSPQPATDGGIERESLDRWVKTAEWIQRAFAVRDLETNYGQIVGNLEILLANHGHQVSMHIRPRSTHDALMYVAAMEIARGTISQTCDKCGTPFLEGGERMGKKRRGGSRFCSDKCRYEYHNEERRKAKAAKS
jgi:hypothetical protein